MAPKTDLQENAKKFVVDLRPLRNLKVKDFAKLPHGLNAEETQKAFENLSVLRADVIAAQSQLMDGLEISYDHITKKGRSPNALKLKHAIQDIINTASIDDEDAADIAALKPILGSITPKLHDESQNHIMSSHFLKLLGRLNHDVGERIGQLNTDVGRMNITKATQLLESALDEVLKIPQARATHADSVKESKPKGPREL